MSETEKLDVRALLKKYETPEVPGTAEQEQLIRRAVRQIGLGMEDTFGAFLYHLMIAQEMRCALAKDLGEVKDLGGGHTRLTACSACGVKLLLEDAAPYSGPEFCADCKEKPQAEEREARKQRQDPWAYPGEVEI